MSDDSRVKHMNDLVTFEHRGLRCAMSARDVTYADSTADAADVLWLWPEAKHEVSVDRYLTIRGTRSTGTLPCSRVRVGRVSTAVSPLSPLLARALEGCCIAGIAEIEGSHFWLIDLDAGHG